MEIVFQSDWMQVIKKGEKYSIQYNSGDLINSINEIEVTKLDAMKAQESDQSAYEIILKYQNLQQRNT